MKRIIALLMIFLLLENCATGSLIKSDYTATSEDQYKNESGKVDLFFEGAYINRSHKQIGFVEARGNPTSTTKELLSFLKYQAYRNGADAVINIKKETIIDETGYLSGDNPVEIYSSPSFYGIAVKYLDSPPDSGLAAVDTSFITQVKGQQNAHLRNSVFAFVVLGAGMLIAINQVQSARTKIVNH
jgi:hypothetical protein